jgi:hypothetical protein
MPFGYGLGVSYANYTPAVVDVPAGSEPVKITKRGDAT